MLASPWDCGGIIASSAKKHKRHHRGNMRSPPAEAIESPFRPFDALADHCPAPSQPFCFRAGSKPGLIRVLKASHRLVNAVLNRGCAAQLPGRNGAKIARLAVVFRFFLCHKPALPTPG